MKLEDILKESFFISKKMKIQVAEHRQKALDKLAMLHQDKNRLRTANPKFNQYVNLKHRHSLSPSRR